MALVNLEAPIILPFRNGIDKVCGFWGGDNAMIRCVERADVNPTRLNAHEFKEKASASPQCAPEAGAPLHAPKTTRTRVARLQQYVEVLL